ncbi:phospholipid-transporting ATPase ABCA3-like [Physella acuta]|uniref:phospholipid-transporting ATPase ABCA3-like n=1 Tax=Physella acuta TaxID=109671 RepID=UPI0027DAF19C|nr:phospholipid-transporting ATPase ABCA3-like [Physella acuta]
MLAAYDYHPSNVYSRPNYFWMDITHVRDMKLMYHITRCFINHWIKRLNMSEYKMPTLYVQEMPPRPKSEIGQLDIEYTILYPLMFIGILSFTASAIVQERESKAKESMKLMGLNESVYWLSWCISSFLSGLIVCICAMLVMTRRYPKGYVWSSPASIVLTLELLFLLDTITAAFLLSCLINKGRNASIIAIILYLILENSASPLIAWVVDQRLLLYLVGTVTYGLGFFLAIDVVFQKEVKGYTLDWDNIHRNYQQPSQTFQDGLVLIALNILFNLFCCCWSAKSNGFYV